MTDRFLEILNLLHDRHVKFPEPLERIRDVVQVRKWQIEKGMLALNFRSPDGSTEVDLLVSESECRIKQRLCQLSGAARTACLRLLFIRHAALWRSTF